MDGQERQEEEGTQAQQEGPDGKPTKQTSSMRSGGGYVTVKQTAINAYTYKLKISIAKMRPADFGEYICLSSNSMGNSSARVLVKSKFRRIPWSSVSDLQFNLLPANQILLSRGRT